MDVDDAKIREEAKAILKEIMDPSPDPKKEQIKIWEVSSHCSRSPTYSLPAGHSRPHDEDGGEASLRKVVTTQEPRSTTKTRRRHQPTVKK